MVRLIAISLRTTIRHPLRTLLVVLSLVLGIVALTSVSAAYGIMRDTITERTIMQGGRQVTSKIEIANVPNRLEVAENWADLSKKIYNNASTALTLDGNGITLSSHGAHYSEIQLTIVSPELLRIKPFRIIEGGWFTEDTYLAPRTVLNEAAGALVGGLDGDVRMQWAHTGESVVAVVQGIVRDGVPSPMVYLDLNQEGPWRDAAIEANSLSLLFQDKNVSPEELQSTLRSLGGIAGTVDTLGEVSRTDTVETLAPELNATQRIFSVISMIALTIAALGILNVGLSTLAERADELSLRRVFGMRRYQILFLMLSESLVLAVISGALGVLLSWLLTPITLNTLGVTSSDLQFPFNAALLGVLAGIITALVGAIVPAIRAMRLPISRIMRD